MTTPNQQYVYVQRPQSQPQSRTSGGGSQAQSRAGSGSTGQTSGPGSRPAQRPVRLPKGVPQVFANERVLFGAWIASMIIVSVDEWHNYGLLPRPSRLWYTSLTYGILAVVGTIDALVPLVNVIGVGFTIMLLWQYYNGSGQFSKTSGTAS